MDCFREVSWIDSSTLVATVFVVVAVGITVVVDGTTLVVGGGSGGGGGKRWRWFSTFVVVVVVGLTVAAVAATVVVGAVLGGGGKAGIAFLVISLANVASGLGFSGLFALVRVSLMLLYALRSFLFASLTACLLGGGGRRGFWLPVGICLAEEGLALLMTGGGLVSSVESLPLTTISTSRHMSTILTVFRTLPNTELFPTGRPRIL